MYTPPSFTIKTIFPGTALEPSLYDIQILSTTSLASSVPVYGSLMDGWCLDKVTSIDVPATYTAYLYSSYELGLLATSGSPIGNNSLRTNLNSINWLLNYYTGTNPGITSGDVQGAIWKLLGQDYRTETWYLGPVTAANVDNLAAMALANHGYVPEVGQAIGIIMDPIRNGVHAQPLILETKAAGLGDFVWHDSNANGRQDAGEAGIAGATVKLVRDLDGDGKFTSANELIATTVTDANGAYKFKGLTPGLSYRVLFETPDGYDVVTARQVDGSASSGVNSDGTLSDVVTLAAGEYRSSIDAGFYHSASLGDRVWLDANGNGRQDAGEAGIAGLKVKLIGGGADGLINGIGDTSVTVNTDAGGNYLFTGLKPGTEYQVEFTRPDGSVYTGRNLGDVTLDSDVDAATNRSQVIKLGSGEVNTTVDAGLYYLASLSDKVWLDANGNGRQDAGEAGVKGVTVTLIGGGADGLLSTTADNTTATDVTDSKGKYQFNGLTPGVEYQVQFTKPAGSLYTARDMGDDAGDSDVDTTTGRSQVVKLSSGDSNTTVDAGIYYNASLGDRVWLDANGNGQQDAGETGVAGQTVTLIGGGGDGLVATTADNTSVSVVTDTSGAYQFTGLTPGVEYQVQFSKPTGSLYTGRDTGDDTSDSDADTATGLSQVVVLSSGDNNTTVDAGIYYNASLGDRLWFDANGNGQQDAGEAGIAGQTVTLIGGGADGLVSTTADNSSVSVVTDANGNYQFTGLTPGVQYQVQFSKPASSVYTGRDIGADASDSDADATTGRSQVVVLASGEVNTTVDAGIYTPAALGDKVWLDANANGRQDAGEAGVKGVTVTLIGGGADGLVSTAADNTTASVVTDASGSYQFTGLTPGVEYQVQFGRPAGYNFATRDVGADTGDSDADAITGKSQVVTLVSGENNLSIDAGLYQNASLGDRVWFDNNSNGRQDAGEAGAAGVAVTLIGGGADGLVATAADNTTASTVTGADGSYQFTGLTPGVEYQVQFGKPAGYVYTGRDIGADTGDSDADGATGLSQVVVLSSGENNTTVDAGIYLPGSLGDRVWIDANTNGQQDGGEAGAAGLTITLLGGGADGLLSTTADNTTATTVTDAGGNYRFTGLAPGVEYQVQFSKLAGYDYIVADVGADASDSDASVSTGRSPVVVLAPGENNLSIDAGLYQAGGAPVGTRLIVPDGGTVLTASLGDRLWLDSNANGRQDAGEAGLAGQTVSLITGGADKVLATTGDNTTLTTVTGADGSYLFSGLTPGVEYQLSFSAPAGYAYTWRNVGFYTGDSDVDATGRSSIIILSSGDRNMTFDAGVYRAGISIDKLVHAEYVTGGNGGTEGVTPGFWKNHADGGSVTTDSAWRDTGILPTESFEAWFGRDVPGTPTLLDALGLGGGGIDALMRHAAAALLNAESPNVDYLYTPGQVISMTQAAIDSASYDSTKDLFAVQNQKEGSTVLTTPAIGWTSVITADTDASRPGTGPVIPLGGKAVYTYLVKNTGEVAIDNVGVGDDRVAGVSFASGDDNGNHLLDVGETWVYRSSERVLSTAEVHGTATATGTAGAAAVSGSDATYHRGTDLAQSIGDRVWIDANGNGRQDAGEAGAAGVTVTLAAGGTDGTLSTTADNFTLTTVTGADGSYGFGALAAGMQYQVQFGLPAGSFYAKRDIGDDIGDSDADTATGKSPVIVLSPGTANTSVDAGIWAYGSVGDRVWQDLNGNGVQDSGEGGIANVTVKLLGSTGSVLATTVTDAAGNYQFGNLVPDSYKVQVVMPSGWFATQQYKGRAALDSEVDASGTSGAFQVYSGQYDAGRDIGLYRKASVGDKVWEDKNLNGLQDPGEGGVAGIKVTLLDGTGTSTVASTTTSSSGTYSFANLAPGSYVLQFDKSNVTYNKINLNTWKWGRKDVGTDDTIDSDVNGDGVALTNVTRTDAFTLVSGQNDLTRDAAVTPLVIDLDGGGIRTLARADDGPAFDLFGNGTAVRSGWIAKGEGFLAVDRNGNGRIDDIGELFGGTARGAGFAQLTAYDSNGDGTVDARDDAFGQLRVWRDANGNHVTDDGELMTLGQAGVASLSVGYVELPFLDANDNLHLERSSATLADGRSVSMTDVYFNVSAGDAAAAGVRLPSLAELLGDDGAVDKLLGGSAAPVAAGVAKADDAGAADASHAEMAELLRRLTTVAHEESAHAAAGG